MKLPRLTAKEAIKLIEKKGFVLVRQSGGHRIVSPKVTEKSLGRFFRSLHRSVLL